MPAGVTPVSVKYSSYALPLTPDAPAELEVGSKTAAVATQSVTVTQHARQPDWIPFFIVPRFIRESPDIPVATNRFWSRNRQRLSCPLSGCRTLTKGNSGAVGQV